MKQLIAQHRFDAKVYESYLKKVCGFTVLNVMHNDIIEKSSIIPLSKKCELN